MEEREIKEVALEASVETAGVASVPPTRTGEASPKKTRRVWRVVALIAGIILLVGVGAVLGGGLVYAQMGGRDARHAQIVVAPRVIERNRRFVIPRSPREFVFDDVFCHLDLDSSLEAAEHGVLVLEVIDDSPAAIAGLEVCDIITHVDGESVEDAESLVDVVAEHKPGDDVTVTVFKPGKAETVEIAVTLAEHPDGETLAYLGVRVGGAFEIDIECGEEDCDSRFLKHLDDISIELGDESHGSLEQEDTIRLFISPGIRTRRGFLYRWHLGNDGIELSLDRGDDI
jgi:hypothetical protein